MGVREIEKVILSGFKKMKANNSNVWICKRQERKNAGANF
jgi:hypothetical protein